MSNSSLVTYTNFTHKCSSREGNSISRIIIHHMACVSTAKNCADNHKSCNRDVSATYYIGKDGDMAQGVDEKYRPWTSTNKSGDIRAVTIEVSNSVNGNPYGGDGWKVSDKSFASLVELCADICKRNGIKELTFTGNKDKDTLSCHKQWYSATVCPGDYLYSKLPELCKKVNEILNPKPTSDKIYYVQIGAFSDKKNAEAYVDKAKKAGFNAVIKEESRK